MWNLACKLELKSHIPTRSRTRTQVPYCLFSCTTVSVGGLVSLLQGCEIGVRALSRFIVLCSWARNFAFTMPVPIPEYILAPANCWGNLGTILGVTCTSLHVRCTGFLSRGNSNQYSQTLHGVIISVKR